MVRQDLQREKGMQVREILMEQSRFPVAEEDT